MKEEDPIMLYKCPGPHRGPHGLCYDFKGSLPSEAKEHEKDGWFQTIREAAEFSGSASFMPPKRKKPPRGVNKYRYGLTNEHNPVKVEQEKKPYRVLTHDQELPEDKPKRRSNKKAE